MRPLKVLLLSDGRPGHYHLAEGVVAALQRVRPVAAETVEMRRRRLIPVRALRGLYRAGLPPRLLLRLGYRLPTGAALPPADLVVSAGRETIPANIAAAALAGAANIFCGSLKNVAPEAFSLVITSYDRQAGLPRHVVTLKPNGMDPDALGRPALVPRFSADNPPKLVALLIGGNSGFFSYREDEWQRLLEFVGEVHDAWGTRWLISTSRRTSDAVADRAATLARGSTAVAEYVDFRRAGPGTLPALFRRADAVVCTEDSSTMISEAVCARLPVIGVSPREHDFKDEEAEYRRFMLTNGWCRFVPIAQLSVARFGAALSAIRPLEGNHLDKLAGILRERLGGVLEKA